MKRTLIGGYHCRLLLLPSTTYKLVPTVEASQSSRRRLTRSTLQGECRDSSAMQEALVVFSTDDLQEDYAQEIQTESNRALHKLGKREGPERKQNRDAQDTATKDHRKSLECDGTRQAKQRERQHPCNGVAQVRRPSST